MIAGAGTYERELRALASGAPHIEFLGRVPHGGLASLYGGAKATIVPSICYETFGLVSLESLCRRTPVISSAFGALPEIIADTGGGCVYRDQQELEAILDRFDQDPGFARSLALEGEAHLSRYSVERHLEAYHRIIEEVRLEKKHLY